MLLELLSPIRQIEIVDSINELLIREIEVSFRPTNHHHLRVADNFLHALDALENWSLEYVCDMFEKS